MLMHNPSMRLTAQELGDGILNVQLRASVFQSTPGRAGHGGAGGYRHLGFVEGG